jgi:hypothetical protein
MKLIAIALLSLLAVAAEKNPALIDMETGAKRPAPAELELASYEAWARSILPSQDTFSAFTPYVFEWYEEERQRASLPAEVSQDPDKIYVRTDRPIRQTDELEGSGEIEEGNTVGAEVYAEYDCTVEQALEAMMYVWGKPTGAGEGETFPPANPYNRRVEYFAPLPEMGEGAYANMTMRKDGGIVKDIFDRYVLLVRGNKERGYTVVMQYVKPALATHTKQVFAIALLTPLANGKTAYRISTRYQGQSYKVLGNISIGRSQIGFNKAKIKNVAYEYGLRIKELKETGSIKDKKTDIGWGK